MKKSWLVYRKSSKIVYQCQQINKNIYFTMAKIEMEKMQPFAMSFRPVSCVRKSSKSSHVLPKLKVAPVNRVCTSDLYSSITTELTGPASRYKPPYVIGPAIRFNPEYLDRRREPPPEPGGCVITSLD